MSAPTVEDVDRISRLDDPVLRNLQITQCYYEISQSVAQLTGFSANWCTFATWASKQAGQTIRMEDLIRAFEEHFYVSPEIAALLEELAGNLQIVGARLKTQISKQAILKALNPETALVRASAAVGRGNKKSSRKSVVSSRDLLSSFTATISSMLKSWRAFARRCGPASLPTDSGS
jgi:hypothetical protein